MLDMLQGHHWFCFWRAMQHKTASQNKQNTPLSVIIIIKATNDFFLFFIKVMANNVTRSNQIVFMDLFLIFFFFSYMLPCFPGGEGHCTNHGGPDHEKGHATSFYQVRPNALHCRYNNVMQW